MSILKQIIQDQTLASGSMKALTEGFWDKERCLRLIDPIGALRSEIRTYSKVFIVIDALDECFEDSQGRLIGELDSLASTIYLMVTSRPLGLIKQLFQGVCNLDINAQVGDIQKYIESQTQ